MEKSKYIIQIRIFRKKPCIPSVSKGTHALNHDIWVIFCVVLNRRTSSTPQSSALKIAQISMGRVVESERNQFLFLQGAWLTRTGRTRKEGNAAGAKIDCSKNVLLFANGSVN